MNHITVKYLSLHVHGRLLPLRMVTYHAVKTTKGADTGPQFFSNNMEHYNISNSCKGYVHRFYLFFKI